jgi:hypothetical protein
MSCRRIKVERNPGRASHINIKNTQSSQKLFNLIGPMFIILKRCADYVIQLLHEPTSKQTKTLRNFTICPTNASSLLHLLRAIEAKNKLKSLMAEIK